MTATATENMGEKKDEMDTGMVKPDFGGAENGMEIEDLDRNKIFGVEPLPSDFLTNSHTKKIDEAATQSFAVEEFTKVKVILPTIDPKP